MKYFIVVCEWNYPTESGRDIIGDYDTRKEAERAAKKEYDDEFDNFQTVTNGLYREACGPYHDEQGNVEGYQLHSSQWESEDFVFRSEIITREL